MVDEGGTNTGPVMTYTSPCARRTYLRVAFSMPAHALRLFSGAWGTMLDSEKLCAMLVSFGMSPAGAMWPRSKPEPL